MRTRPSARPICTSHRIAHFQGPSGIPPGAIATISQVGKLLLGGWAEGNSESFGRVSERIERQAPSSRLSVLAGISPSLFSNYPGSRAIAVTAWPPLRASFRMAKPTKPAAPNKATFRPLLLHLPSRPTWKWIPHPRLRRERRSILRAGEWRSHKAAVNSDPASARRASPRARAIHS